MADKIKAIWFDPEAAEHIISYGSRVVAFERDNLFDDAGDPINWRIDTATFFIDQGDEGVIHFLFIDANTGGVVVTPQIVTDGTVHNLPPFSSTTRTIHEFPINRKTRRLSVQLSGIGTARIQIHGITIDTRGGSGREYRA